LDKCITFNITEAFLSINDKKIKLLRGKMSETNIQNIITRHAKELEKKINLRVMVLIDPTIRNPYDGPLAVYAPGMLHITTDKFSDHTHEFEKDTEKYLKAIISKEETKIPRTIYISTDTRRIFLRSIRVPNKRLPMLDPIDRERAPKEFTYYLGVSVIKNLAHVGKEVFEEKPQAIFDEIDKIVKELDNYL